MDGSRFRLGQLTETIIVNPNFRADFREFRPVIHLAPVAPIQLVQNIVKSSTGQYTCDGDGVHLSPVLESAIYEHFNWSELEAFYRGTQQYRQLLRTNISL